MYITTDIDDIVRAILNKPNLNILVAKTDEISTLVIQTLIREDVEYLALRNIEIYERHQRKGILKRIINAMGSTDRNILIDHILNPVLFNYFYGIGYEPFSYIIDDVTSYCMRKTSNNLII